MYMYIYINIHIYVYIYDTLHGRLGRHCEHCHPTSPPHAALAGYRESPCYGAADASLLTLAGFMSHSRGGPVQGWSLFVFGNGDRGSFLVTVTGPPLVTAFHARRE